MKVTAKQLAWYIERDGWTVQETEGGWLEVSGKPGTLCAGTRVTVPAWMVRDLDAEREIAYRAVAAKRRAAAREIPWWER